LPVRPPHIRRSAVRSRGPAMASAHSPVEGLVRDWVRRWRQPEIACRRSASPGTAASHPPPRFWRRDLSHFVDEKMFQRCQQEGAEPPAFGAQACEVILPGEARKEGLGSGPRRPPSYGRAGGRRHRVENPVSAQSLFQRATPIACAAASGGQDDRPVRRGERCRRRGRGDEQSRVISDIVGDDVRSL